GAAGLVLSACGGDDSPARTPAPVATGSECSCAGGIGSNDAVNAILLNRVSAQAVEVGERATLDGLTMTVVEAHRDTARNDSAGVVVRLTLVSAGDAALPPPVALVCQDGR